MDDSSNDRRDRAPPSLSAALRRARAESAEHNQAVNDLREAEIARLELLEEAIRPILEQAPPGVDIFDSGIAYGGRPRLFIDMIGFVEMADEKRCYRFLQDTRHGRILLAESPNIDVIAAAINNYVACRLIERERALASDWRSGANDESVAQTRPLLGQLRRPASPGSPPQAKDARPEPHRPSQGLPLRAAVGDPVRRAHAVTMASDVFHFVFLTLGAIAFLALLGAGGFAIWALWLRGLWPA